MNPVPEAILKLVREERVSLSGKARRRLFEDGFSLQDLLCSLLCGKVTKKERDKTRVAKYKYIIQGPSVSGRPVYSCGKVVSDESDTSYFVITAHEAEDA